MATTRKKAGYVVFQAKRNMASLLHHQAFEFRRQGVLTDVTVVITDYENSEGSSNGQKGTPLKKFHCHKLILAAYSRTLHHLLKRPESKKTLELCITSKQIPPKYFALMLDYLYKGHLEIRQDELPQLRYCAFKLQIECLLDEIEKWRISTNTQIPGMDTYDYDVENICEFEAGLNPPVVNETEQGSHLDLIQLPQENKNKKEMADDNNSDAATEEIPNTSRNVARPKKTSGLKNRQKKKSTKQVNVAAKINKDKRVSQNRKKIINKGLIMSSPGNEKERMETDNAPLTPTTFHKRSLIPKMKLRPRKASKKGGVAGLKGGSADTGTASKLRPRCRQMKVEDVVVPEEEEPMSVPKEVRPMAVPKRKVGRPRGSGKKSSGRPRGSGKKYSGRPRGSGKKSSGRPRGSGKKSRGRPRGSGKKSKGMSPDAPASNATPRKRGEQASDDDRVLASLSEEILTLTSRPSKYSRTGRLIKPNNTRYSPQQGISAGFLISKMKTITDGWGTETQNKPRDLETGSKVEAQSPVAGPSPKPSAGSAVALATTVEVPTWRVTDMNEIFNEEENTVNTGFDDMSNEAFALRHRKSEMQEKQRKRWDRQRMREAKSVDKLKARQDEKQWNARYKKAVSQIVAKRKANQDKKAGGVDTNPSLENIVAIYVGEELPPDVYEYAIPAEDD